MQAIEINILQSKGFSKSLAYTTLEAAKLVLMHKPTHINWQAAAVRQNLKQEENHETNQADAIDVVIIAWFKRIAHTP